MLFTKAEIYNSAYVIIFLFTLIAALLMFGFIFYMLMKIGKRKSKNNISTIPYYDEYNRTWKCRFPDREETGSLTYVVSEFAQDSLIYHYTANGEVIHEHEFSDVLTSILTNYTTFSIEGYEDEYSKQEIRIINNLIDKLKLAEVKE